MRELPHDSDASGEESTGPGTPRWVKVFGIVLGVVILLFLALLLTRGHGGGHGPSQHMPSGDLSGYTWQEGVTG